MDGIRKLSAFMPVSQEMLAAQANTAAALRALWSRTPEEWAEVEARQAARRAARLAEATGRHAVVRAKVDGTLAQVLDLHAPESSTLSPVCRGCNFGGYDAEAPEWPCETWALIAEGLE